MDALSYLTHTVLAQSQTGKLTEKAKTDFFERLSKALDVATPLRRRHRKFKRLVVQMDRQARAPLDMDGPPGREPQDSNGLWARVLAAIF
jgi:hypothetical protein